MVRIITIPNDNDQQINDERHRIVPWARQKNWCYIGYNDQIDHIAQIRLVGSQSQLDVLDFDCHGGPTWFNHTYISSAIQYGQDLSNSPGFSINTVIYLDACNTGLGSKYGGPIAQAVANGAGCKVYGTKGYMKGTFAEGTEDCKAAPDGLAPYPGAKDSTGQNVWLEYQPRKFEEEEMIGLRSYRIHTDRGDFRELITVIEHIINGQPIKFPNWRMAPDATFNYVRGEEVMILDMYANGSLLRSRISGMSWRVPRRLGFDEMVLNTLI